LKYGINKYRGGGEECIGDRDGGMQGRRVRREMNGKGGGMGRSTGMSGRGEGSEYEDR